MGAVISCCCCGGSKPSDQELLTLSKSSQKIGNDMSKTHPDCDRVSLLQATSFNAVKNQSAARTSMRRKKTHKQSSVKPKGSSKTCNLVKTDGALKANGSTPINGSGSGAFSSAFLQAKQSLDKSMIGLKTDNSLSTQSNANSTVNLVGSSVASGVQATKLFQDQSKLKTTTGDDVNHDPPSRPMTSAIIEAIRNNPNTPVDQKLILSSTFASLDKIVDGLYLTGIFGLERSAIKAANIALVINATNEWPLLKGKFDCYRVPVVDDAREPIGQYFDDVANLIEATRRAGANSVVHCVAGVSRSSTLVLAYLIKHAKMNLYKAFRHTRDIRNCIRPNMGFFRQLVDYEAKVHGKASVRMIQVEDEKTKITVTVPHFYPDEYPELYQGELAKAIKHR